MLIIGGTQALRQECAYTIIKKLHFSSKTNDPDLITITSTTTIGIGEVRELKHSLSRKPFQSDSLVALINDAQRLTIPAQNALLKLLEETTDQMYIILIAPSDNQFLPTVISRCQLIRLKVAETDLNVVNTKTITGILSQLNQVGAADRLNAVLPYIGTKEAAIEFCTDLLRVYHQSIPAQNLLLTTAERLNNIQSAINYLHNNVNPKLVIENLVLSW